MAWISTRELADVILHAMFSTPTTQEQRNLQKQADNQLRSWRTEAMNFGDCASDLLTSAFNLNGNGPSDNPFFGCSAPQSSSSSQQENDQLQQQAKNLSMAAALMLDEIASPSRWIEAQMFSDKPRVVSILHQVGFYARPYSTTSANNESRQSENNNNIDFEFPNALNGVVLNNSTGNNNNNAHTQLEYKTARFALNALAGIAVAEFPNSNWTSFIYAVTKTNSNSRAPSSSSPSSPNSPNRGNNNTNHQGFPNNNNNHNQNTFADVPLTRRYLWMYFVTKRLDKLPLSTSDSFSEERIGLRLALLDFLENAMKEHNNSRDDNTSNEESIFQWKLARILILQLPASKRHSYPVVRSIVSEAANRIFSSANTGTNTLISESWSNPLAMMMLRDQIYLLEAAPPNLVVSPMAKLLERSICSHNSNNNNNYNNNNTEDFSYSSSLPGPLWKISFAVISSFLDKCYDEDDIKEFCDNFVPMDVLVRLVGHALTIAPGSDEVFAVPRHKALLGSEEVNDDDIQEVCSPSDFLLSSSSSSSASQHAPPSKLFWRSQLFNSDLVNKKLKGFYEDDVGEYYANREASLVNDVKELDGGCNVAGDRAGSLSSFCIAIVERLVELAPDVASNAIGQVVAAELLLPTNNNNNNDGNNNSNNNNSKNNIHGVCTLLLSAFRVFNINGSSTFAKAVCDQNAAMLLERLMDICVNLIHHVFSAESNVNNNNNQSTKWDAVHSASRLLFVGCILCEGVSNSDDMMEKFLESILYKILVPSSSSNVNNKIQRNVLVLHSAAIYCLFRICVRSPKLRSRITLDLFQNPENIPVFVDVLRRTPAGCSDVEEQFPFSCYAISELTTCVLGLGSPEHLDNIWKSEKVFGGFIVALTMSLARGSLRVEGVVSQSLKKMLGLVVSDHVDTRHDSCMQVQAILNPVVKLVLFGEDDGNNNINTNNNSDSDNNSTSPAARVLCVALKELFLGKYSSECSCIVDEQRCSFSYQYPFALLTQKVALSDALAKPQDSTVRTACFCLSSIVSSFSGLENSNNKTSSVVLNMIFQFLELDFLGGGGGTSSSMSSSSSFPLLLARTISTWGFAAGFCLRTLARIQHPAIDSSSNNSNNILKTLAIRVMKATCSYLRRSTRDCDLAGICFLIGVIGQLNVRSLSEAIMNNNSNSVILAQRDAGLFWSLLCTCACEMSEREFAPVAEMLNNLKNFGGSEALLSAQLNVYILPPSSQSGSRKTGKNSIVADDFARLGKHFNCLRDAVGFVMETGRQYGNNNNQDRKKIHLFSEPCYSRLF